MRSCALVCCMGPCQTTCVRLHQTHVLSHVKRETRVPGFLAEEVRPYKKLRNKGHIERVEAVRKLQAAAEPGKPADTPAQVHACLASYAVLGMVTDDHHPMSWRHRCRVLPGITKQRCICVIRESPGEA